MWQLALKNLRGRRAYNAIIVLAAALAVAMVFIAMLMSGSVQNELQGNPRLMGADLAVVPAGTKEKGQTYLVKGPPAQGSIPAGTLEQLSKFSEIEVVTSQKIIGHATVAGVRVTLITFDLATDFVVQPWLDRKSSKSFQGRAHEILLGARVDPKNVSGATLEVNGENFTIAGRLQETDTFLDTAIFLPAPEGQNAEASWILLRLQSGTLLDYMTNKLETNLEHIDIISRPEMLKTIDDQLFGLLQGGGFDVAALLVVIGVLLVTGAMFALSVNERKREFGLLKAMGAGNTAVFKLIIIEAAMLVGLGGILGIVLSAVWLLLTSAGFAFVDFASVSLLGVLFYKMLLTLLLTIAVGVLTALYPALLARRIEPYAAIRSGE